jgi:hypothetical protein
MYIRGVQKLFQRSAGLRAEGAKESRYFLKNCAKGIVVQVKASLMKKQKFAELYYANLQT